MTKVLNGYHEFMTGRGMKTENAFVHVHLRGACWEVESVGIQAAHNGVHLLQNSSANR